MRAGGKERGRPIEFSDPKSDEVSTNLHQLTSKKDSLKQLEEDLSKSMRTFSGASSLDGVAPPPLEAPPGPVVPSKRLKELMERRKNAIFLTPEDLARTPTLQQMLRVPEYGPDGMEKQAKSPLEAYYERLDGKRTGAAKSIRFEDDEMSARSDFPTRESGASGPSDDLTLPPALKEREEALKKLFESEGADNPLAPAPLKRNTFSDIFGLGEATPSADKGDLKLKKMRDEFNSIWDSSRPAASADALNPLVGSTESPHRLPNPFGVPDSSPEVISPVNPVFTPLAPLDVNNQMQPSLPVTPKIDVSKPVAPTFTAPRRPF